MLDYNFDKEYSEKFGPVCGTDEAGRGPLAGPVVAAAVILPANVIIEGLDDSKALSEKKREKLYDEIIEKSIAYGIAESSHAEIDEVNILNASLNAMKKAVIAATITFTPSVILLDGNRNTDFGIPSYPIVKGDSKSQSIAAASVLAKVYRDRMMAEYAKLYPQYGFEKHKGYPTKDHMLAVYEYGPCEIHRKTFLSFLVKDKDKLQAALEEKYSEKNAD